MDTLLKTVRLAWRAALLLLLLAALCVATFLGVLQARPAALEPLVERGATFLLGRQLAIGELRRVQLGRELEIELHGLELANPAWAGEKPLLFANYLRVVVSLPSLLNQGSVLFHDTEIRDLQLELLAPEGVDPNWLLPIASSNGEDAAEQDEFLLPIVFERISLQNLELEYRDHDRQVAVAIDELHLDRDQATGLSLLSLAGGVNGLPLGARGLLGPTAALQTGKHLQLDIALSLGDMRIKAVGEIADTLAMAGADLVLDVRAPRSRPVLDILGLQEVRDGPLVFEGHLADAGPGLLVEAEGELADFGLGAHGVIKNPAELDGIELSFYIDGPSMQETGAVFGIAGLKDVPFDLSGDIVRSGPTLQVANGRFRAAQGQLWISGLLPSFPDIDDWEVDLRASQLDLSILGSVLGVETLPQLYCDVEGRLYSDEQGVELVDLTVRDHDVVLVVNGVVGEQPELIDTDLHARFSGGDLTRLQPLIGLQALPAVAYALEGSLQRDASGWRIENARLNTPGLQLKASAQVDQLADFRRLRGSFSASSTDIMRTLSDYGVNVDALAPIPLQLEGQARLEDEGFRITDVAGRFAELAFSGDGWLSAQEDLRGSRLRLDARGENIGSVLAAFTEGDVPAQAFSLSMDATYHPPLVTVDRLQAQVGSNQVSAQLQLDDDEQGQSARGQAMLQGPRIEELLQLYGLDQKFASGSYRASSELELSADHLALTGLAAETGGSDINGDIRLRFGEVPRLDMDLHSRSLQLLKWFAELDEHEEEDPAQDRQTEQQLMTPPSGKDLRERLIPDAALPLDWINQIEGRWRYRVDRAQARQDAYAALNLELDLSAGVLRTREFTWDGTASSGWAEVQVDAHQGPYKLQLKTASNSIPLSWLFTETKAQRQDANYRGSFMAVGSTTRQLAASLTGEMVLRGGGARVSNRGLDFLLGDVFEAVVDRLNPFTTAEEYTSIECVAGAMKARDGLVTIDPGLVMRSDRIDIVSSGTVDLNTEALNVAFNTRARRGIGISAGKAITPYLKIAGNLANPWLTVDPQAVAVSGTAAVATAGLSILAESMYDRWIATAKNPCEKIYKQVRRDDSYRQLLSLPDPD